MLIDGTHAEETRVVVADDTELLEFDFETTTKSQLKGNIYLAKVTRVEPSLQAAFVDFGGNRHGFLAFSEIHPDYYRIPVEDKEALIAKSDVSDEIDEIDIDEFKNEDINDNAESESNPVEVIGDNAEDDIAELGDAHRKRLRQLTRMYKIQEVIKRRQILLVQVVKEERGNKGAALTTYLSLPGRYCVLMPNTSRGGGISRKISNPAHRKRMKTIMADLVIPEGMAVIMRTAGVERNKAEVRRDYEYLRRSWDDIREQTLQSSAPALIYEEGDLIKRSLRDVYNREIEEVIVSSKDMSFDEYVKLRMMGFTLWMSTKGVLYDSLLKFLRQNNLDVFELFRQMVEQLDTAPSKIQQIFDKNKTTETILCENSFISLGSMNIHANGKQAKIIRKSAGSILLTLLK